MGHYVIKKNPLKPDFFKLRSINREIMDMLIFGGNNLINIFIGIRKMIFCSGVEIEDCMKGEMNLFRLFDKPMWLIL